jgi:hypothetical protein
VIAYEDIRDTHNEQNELIERAEIAHGSLDAGMASYLANLGYNEESLVRAVHAYGEMMAEFIRDNFDFGDEDDPEEELYRKVAEVFVPGQVAQFLAAAYMDGVLTGTVLGRETTP